MLDGLTRAPHPRRNRTGIENDSNNNGSFGYVMLIGLLGSLFAFSGYEAGAHMVCWRHALRHEPRA